LPKPSTMDLPEESDQRIVPGTRLSPPAVTLSTLSIQVCHVRTRGRNPHLRRSERSRPHSLHHFVIAREASPGDGPHPLNGCAIACEASPSSGVTKRTSCLPRPLPTPSAAPIRLRSGQAFAGISTLRSGEALPFGEDDEGRTVSTNDEQDIHGWTGVLTSTAQSLAVWILSPPSGSMRDRSPPVLASLPCRSMSSFPSDPWNLFGTRAPYSLRNGQRWTARRDDPGATSLLRQAYPVRVRSRGRIPREGVSLCVVRSCHY
jgi:hypothetical protein